MVRYPPLVLSFTQAHLCDTPFCYVSRDNCAIPHKKQARKCFCDTIATSIARYEKYRCWASKPREHPKTSERRARSGDLVAECTFQRSPGNLSETLPEPLSECHLSLRVAGLVLRPSRPSTIAAKSLKAEKRLRVARLQNETAPEKRFEKREKGSEKRSETRPKNV